MGLSPLSTPSVRRFTRPGPSTRSTYPSTHTSGFLPVRTSCRTQVLPHARVSPPGVTPTPSTRVIRRFGGGPPKTRPFTVIDYRGPLFLWCPRLPSLYVDNTTSPTSRPTTSPGRTVLTSPPLFVFRETSFSGVLEDYPPPTSPSYPTRYLLRLLKPTYRPSTFDGTGPSPPYCPPPTTHHHPTPEVHRHQSNFTFAGPVLLLSCESSDSDLKSPSPVRVP